MSILVNKRTRIVVQGLGDDAERLHMPACLGYGHGRRCFVAGVAPSMAGRLVDGIPIFENVADAREATGANTCVVYASAGRTAAAIEEAAEARMELVVCISNGVSKDELRDVRGHLEASGTRLLGPGCAGLVTPAEVKIGGLPGEAHRRGHIGIISRSLGLTALAARQLVQFGLGTSTAVGLAEDHHEPTHLELLKLFEQDPATDAVLLIGPIDEASEAACAAWIRAGAHKPLVGYIDEADPARAQRTRLQDCGVHMTRNPAMLGELTASVVDTRWLPFD
ncbi:succinate--CoA ligase subunit alpha [Ideonella sp. YS5]|uniref:succinate--CoA ligase subunit alpha n=1 Tax=Ideonella sp. YS5 TaxID=3453714 RepID=UPI003EEECADC